jgi:hypothetical protein
MRNDWPFILVVGYIVVALFQQFKFNFTIYTNEIIKSKNSKMSHRDDH